MTETTNDGALTLATLRLGQRLQGLVPGQTVTLLAIDPIDHGLFEVFYRDDSGHSGARAITDADVARFEIAGDSDTALPYDADPDEFRLAAEALRIKYAALYDPMVAVNSSDVDPLPHQIRAVYDELLPRIPLRFLLADDPGAGKTIMAGLYLKELMLRSDCERAIIVAPGGLVEQWREELRQKFDLRFEVFNRQMIDDAQGRNVFAEHPYLIARMDQLSRSEDLIEQLGEVSWDVAVVDEAHRMAAHYSSWAGEVDETKRFKLGRLLSETAHNFLLMTATPHAGKEEDFQLFMSLLDRDRFEGKFREGVHRTDTCGLMRRMVKEDLLTFEGKPLFPERKAYTVEYELSLAERDLNEHVAKSAFIHLEPGRELFNRSWSKRGRGRPPTVSKRSEFDLYVKDSYKPLWKLLVDKERLKQDLRESAKLSSASMARISNGANLTTDVLLRVCPVLDCQIGDIVEVIPVNNKKEEDA